MPDDLYAIRIGCLMLLRKPNDSSDTAAAIGEIGRSVRERILQSPVVTEEPEGSLTPGHIQGNVRIMPGMPARDAIRFEEPLTFKVHWPRKNQELFDYQGECLEDFTVSYDGMLYSVVARCDEPLPRSYSFSLGREGHRVIKSVLGVGDEREDDDVMPGDEFDLVIIGPTPMYAIFYVAFAEEPASFDFGRELSDYGDTLESILILPAADYLDRNAYIQGLIERLSYPIRLHYSALAWRLEFYHQQGMIYEHSAAATSTYGEMIRPFPWREPRGWLDRPALPRRLRHSIASSYEHFTELEEARAAGQSLAQSASDLFARYSLLEPRKEYPTERLNDIQDWHGQHIMQGIRFFAEEARIHSMERATVVGPLIGALIAIVATVLALLLS